MLALKILVTRSGEDIRDFIENMTGIQKAMLIKYEESMESLTKDLSDEEKEEYYERSTDEYWQLATTFPGILNNTLFLSINSFLEFYMFQMCKLHEAYFPEIADLEKEGNSGICKYKSFLKKHKISDPFGTSSEWIRISVYRKARNFISHSYSILDETKNARNVIEFAEKNPGLISIDSHRKIWISYECNVDFLNCAEVFLHELADLAREKTKRSKKS
jgi:hypothetical protein